MEHALLGRLYLLWFSDVLQYLVARFANGFDESGSRNLEIYPVSLTSGDHLPVSWEPKLCCGVDFCKVFSG